MTPTDTKAFLKEIYKNCTEGYITIVTLPEREVYWFKVKDINTAAMKVVKCGKRTNTYFGIALRKEILPNNARGGERDVIVVPVLYADIDIKGKAHAKEELPETKEQAIEFLNSLPVKPSISVWSGNGIHAYWLLDKPFKISNDEDRERISGLISGWGTYINKMGAEKNWKIDNVYDLARVLRVPGTVNHKLADGEMCSVIENTGERYDISVFEPYRMVQPPAEKHEEAVDAPVGNADRIIEKCGFIRHCRDNAATLSEPYWHAMVTNISLARDGPEVVHTLSQPYPSYNAAETDEKIKRAIKENKPHTCRFIREKLGYKCQDKCKVKAPVVYAVLTMEERIQKLVSEDITDIAKALSDEVLELMAYAKDRMPAEYAKFKLKLKNKMSLRDFEKAVNHKAQSYAANLSDRRKKPVLLEGLDLKGIVQPSGWEISIKTGVKKYTKVMDTVFVTTVCPSALVISKRLENLDDDTEKVEVKFYRNGRWKAFLAPRSQVFSKNSLMKYADSGLPVSSESSEELVIYLWDFENVNLPV
ncbi:MAG: DUF927 domain-containing protein, partial [Eubacteriales bacterium]|nr:DUF927 domain-containing protein [Eubacteriales bacterium]